MAAFHRFRFERGLLAAGVTPVAGVDEAGRGPLAGPVVAAAVILPQQWIADRLPRELKGLNDSKQLTEEERERFFSFLTSHSEVRFGIGQCDSTTIDQINILRATHRAMQQALDQLQPAPGHLLIDGLRVHALRHPQTALVKGDSRSYSIAAASVLAKVTRDRVMVEFDRAFPLYGFGTHKGYGTPEHLAALTAHGPCAIHRHSFAPIRQPDPWLFDDASLAATQSPALED